MKTARQFALFLLYMLTLGASALLTHLPDTAKPDDRPELEAKADIEFLSPTKCKGNPHGVYRWIAKTDQTKPQGAVSITPADVANWKDPLAKVSADSLRLAGTEEVEWFELTGKVVLVKCEEDGDLHVQLADPDGKGVNVVAEIPLGKPWDDIRKEVFSWAPGTKFPCKPHKLKLQKYPVIVVIGRGFWDGEHHGKIENRRNYDDNVTTWEFHPIMHLEETK